MNETSKEDDSDSLNEINEEDNESDNEMIIYYLSDKIQNLEADIKKGVTHQITDEIIVTSPGRDMRDLNSPKFDHNHILNELAETFDLTSKY